MAHCKIYQAFTDTVQGASFDNIIEFWLHKWSKRKTACIFKLRVDVNFIIFFYENS